MIIDSSILIDHLKGVVLARLWINAVAADEGLQTHFVAAAEVISGAGSNRELRAARLLLAKLSIVHSDESDAERSIDLLTAHRLRGGVGWPDCLIAATCQRLNLPIATLNDKHFRVFEGLRVIRPY